MKRISKLMLIIAGLAVVMAVGQVVRSRLRQAPVMVSTTPAQMSYITITSVDRHHIYSSPTPGMIHVQATAQVYTVVDEGGDWYWFVRVVDWATEKEILHQVYKDLPYRPTLNTTEHPKFDRNVAVPPGAYKVGVGLISPAKVLLPNGQEDPFGNYLVGSFFAEVH
jgi:hypothetical protein